MAGFIRRIDNRIPSLEEILEIEGVLIADLIPDAPITGDGSGTVLVTAEFEDGPFANGDNSDYFDEDRNGEAVVEVFGSTDLRNRFGGLGFGAAHRNASARQRNGELWNGNGFIKTRFLLTRRLQIARVDTRVGEVVFNALACIKGGEGPFDLAVGDTLSITTDVGGPGSTDAIAATAAVVTGSGGTFPTGFTGGETISIELNGSGNPFEVQFASSDQSLTEVIARINGVAGFTLASDNAGELELTTQRLGTSAEIVLADVTSGVLATLGHSAGTTNGTGNVANVDAVTVDELVTIINGSAALSGVSARKTDGALRICSVTPEVGTIEVTASTMATELELDPIGSTVDAGVHDAGTIPAGTRVQDGSSNTWVTMQTLSIPEGTSSDKVGGPFSVPVRPAFDDGSAASASANAVTSVVDQPNFLELDVDNPGALTAALTEGQMDSAYEEALDATIDPNGVAAEANYLICARRSDALDVVTRANVNDASSQGHVGRKVTQRAPVGVNFSPTQAIAAVASRRDDRMFYTYPGFKVRIPEIAETGATGGVGFTDDGVITVGADAPLTSINAILNPEEDPGQATGLLPRFFAVEDVGTKLTIETYKAFKREGIAAPRVDRRSGTIFQSGITSSTTSGEENQARRKMADFIQDTLADRAVRLSKKLNKQSRRNAIRLDVEAFLRSLERPDNPDLARIAGFSVREDNTADELAAGIFRLVIRVRTFSSLKDIVLQTTIGESVEIEQTA